MARMDQNAAYDLSRFEEKAKEPKISVVKTPQNKPKKKPHTMRIVSLAMVVTLIMTAFIYSQMMLNELTSTIYEANKDLSVLRSENTRLNMELESKTSLKNAEEIATAQLGLSKMQRSQTEYVQLTQGDKVEVAKQQSSFPGLDGIINWFQSLFGKIKEYLS